MNWLFLGTAGAALVAGWSYLRNLWQQVVGLLLRNVVCTGRCADVVMWYLQKHGKPLIQPAIEYAGDRMYVSLSRRSEVVVFRQMFGGSFVWVGNTLIYSYRVQAPQNPLSQSTEPQGLRLTYLRWTFNPEQFIKTATAAYNSYFAMRETFNRVSIRECRGLTKKQADIFSRGAQNISMNEAATPSNPMLCNDYVTHRYEDLGYSTGDAAAGCMLAIEGEVAALFREFAAWFSASDWYLSRNLPWQRKWLLVGAPGTGKTSSIRELSRRYGVPLTVMHLQSMDNSELTMFWNAAQTDTPRIVVIEDFDAVFHGRQPVNDCQLTFDEFLNVLDGLSVAHGLAVMITTNHPEHLDDALAGGGKITRPGRIDSVIHFEPLSKDGRRQLVQRILPDHPEVHDTLLLESEGESPALFQERCLRCAMSFWPGVKDVSVSTVCEDRASAAGPGVSVVEATSGLASSDEVQPAGPVACAAAAGGAGRELPADHSVCGGFRCGGCAGEAADSVVSASRDGDAAA